MAYNYHIGRRENGNNDINKVNTEEDDCFIN